MLFLSRVCSMWNVRAINLKVLDADEKLNNYQLVATKFIKVILNLNPTCIIFPPKPFTEGYNSFKS